MREWIAKVANLKFLLEEGDVDGALQIARSLEDAMGETLNDLSNEGNEGGSGRTELRVFHSTFPSFFLLGSVMTSFFLTLQ